MTALLSRRRLAVAGGLAAVAVGGATGTVLAVHGQSGSSAQDVAASASPSPSPGTPGKGHGNGKANGLRGHLGLDRVVSTGSNSITVADHTGAQHTYAVAPRARITDADGKTESLSSLKTDELVVLVLGGKGHKPGDDGTSSSSSSTPTASPSATATPTVVMIRDTGFAAAH